MICSSYHDEPNWIGRRGVCWGTKEQDPCECGGDESRCDFYEYKRERANMNLSQRPEDQTGYPTQATTTTAWPPSPDYCASRLPCGVCMILDKMCPKVGTYQVEPTWRHLPTSVCATGDAPEAKL